MSMTPGQGKGVALGGEGARPGEGRGEATFWKSWSKPWVEPPLWLILIHSLNGQDFIKGGQRICFLDFLLFSLAFEAKNLSVKIKEPRSPK